MEQVFAAPRFIADWQAIIQGGDSWTSKTGFGDPNAFATCPAALSRATEWHSTQSDAQVNRVAVAEAELTREGYIVIGMGCDIEKAIRHPKQAWDAALSRNKGIASRVSTQTPDQHLDAAVRMMSFATEGTWGDSTVMHGGWSWRFGYLGWRGWYGISWRSMRPMVS
jgi:hypothetical protein